VKMNKAILLTSGAIFAAMLAHGNGVISYTCAADVAASTCNYLNTVIAGQYGSTFTNATASIYIQYGTTGLAQSQTAFNTASYAQYAAALAANSNMSSIQTQALASLTANAAGIYGSDTVVLTAPLASALGITDALDPGADVGNGVPVGSATPCALGTTGCYDGVITVTNDPGTPLYYEIGPEASDAYDFYATVEHETDEILGTSSCMTTSGSLADGCDGFGPGTPSAVDLYRYSGLNTLVTDGSLSTTPGAYFSYNGGSTNGTIGVGGSPKVYNTLANGEDYADFLSSSPDCGTNQAVQDAEGCPGEDAGLTILNDGRSEINILNAVGFDVPSGTATPEPSTLALLGLSIGVLALIRRKRVV
jgi:PEP-CTERM motif